MDQFFFFKLGFIWPYWYLGVGVWKDESRLKTISAQLVIWCSDAIYFNIFMYTSNVILSHYLWYAITLQWRIEYCLKSMYCVYKSVLKLFEECCQNLWRTDWTTNLPTVLILSKKLLTLWWSFKSKVVLKGQIHWNHTMS